MLKDKRASRFLTVDSQSWNYLFLLNFRLKTNDDVTTTDDVTPADDVKTDETSCGRHLEEGKTFGRRRFPFSGKSLFFKVNFFWVFCFSQKWLITINMTLLFKAFMKATNIMRDYFRILSQELNAPWANIAKTLVLPVIVLKDH